ncbi:1675_t:CDS:2, partial [Entrophospora sp. SA101]
YSTLTSPCSISTTSQTFLTNFFSNKMISRSSSYGPMDNYIVWPLSTNDQKKFNVLLLRLTISCGWVNKPEAKEFFNFLNPSLKLPYHCVLG